MGHIHDFDKVYFEWDTFNIEHIRRHGIEPFEVEDAFLGDRNKKVFFDKNHSDDYEQRFIILAITSKKTFLKIVICYYENKIRVITAHKASNDRNLFKLYKKK